MAVKRTTAQHGYQLLVANFSGGGDPSQGRNPVSIRHEFVYQHCPEIPGKTSEFGPGTEAESTPGLRTKMGTLDYTTPPMPLPSAATITVASTDFTAPASLLLSDFELVSDEDYNAATGTTYTNEDITNTPPNGALTLFDTTGPNFINVPANVPITPGTVTISWTSGGTVRSQTDDGVGGFAGDGNPAGSAITYATGAITLDTAALPPDGATTILITYTADITPAEIGTNLAAAIDALPGFNATALGPAITVVGPPGLDGLDLRFEAVYGGAVQNFTLNPADGSLAGAEPWLGPPDIT